MLLMNRSYKKGSPHRDFRKFIVVAEGEREDDYFRYFENLSQKFVLEIVEREGGKSAAKFLIERLEAYNLKYGIEKEDFIWFIMDIDRWPRNVINDIIHYCSEDKNRNVCISNPCFEVWLYYHIVNEIPSNIDSAAKLKANLPKLIRGGYNRIKFISLIETAIENSAKKDKHHANDFPDLHITKVYKLADKLLQFLEKQWNHPHI